MNKRNVNVDYCGIIILLRQMIQAGNLSENEAKKIASRISIKMGVTVNIPL